MSTASSNIEHHMIEVVEDLLSLVGPVQDATTRPLFRGHANAAWTLTPRLFRFKKRPVLASTWKLFEAKLLTDFWRRAVAMQPKPDSALEQRAIAQHHGLPTRLLDWSENPLVAVAFAVLDDCDTHGTVWEIRTSGTLHGDLPHGDGTTPAGHTWKYFPPHISPRITAQQACFTVHALPPEPDPFVALEEQAAAGASGCRLRRFNIEKSSKRSLRHQLSALGLGPAGLYPDLDGFAREASAVVQQALDLQG